MFSAWRAHYRSGAEGPSGAVLSASRFGVAGPPLVARGPGKLPLVSRPLDVDVPSVPARPARGADRPDGSSARPCRRGAEGAGLGKVLDNGAAMPTTIRQPDPIWTTVAAGAKRRWASVDAVTGAGLQRSLDLLPTDCYARGLVLRVRAPCRPSASVRARPLWTSRVAGKSGRRQLTLTYPRRRCGPGSDQFYRPGAALAEPDDSGRDADPAERPALPSMQPPALFEQARAAGYRAAPATGNEPGRDLLDTPPFVTDGMYEQVTSALDETIRPDLSVVRYRELDAAGHRFLRYAMPRDFGDVSLEERRRYGLVLEGAYARVDAIVGRALAALGPDDLLLIVSGFGMEPLSVGKRMLERYLGTPDLSGTHEDAPDGFMLAYGTDGRARIDVFRREFSDGRPVTGILTYER
jgi:hypothetical protein